MQDFEWITFDCYGTLIDWENGISQAFEKVARASYMPYDREQVLGLYRKYEAEEEQDYRKYSDILNRVSRRICVELGYRTVTYGFLKESISRWRPFADTNPALEKLARKCRLGILSNIDNDLIAQTCRHFTVTFELIVTAEKVGSYKPDLDHFQTARQQIGEAKWIHAAQSYYHDIVPCRRLGVKAAWINRHQEALADADMPMEFHGSDLASFANWMLGEGDSPRLPGWS